MNGGRLHEVDDTIADAARTVTGMATLTGLMRLRQAVVAVLLDRAVQRGDDSTAGLLALHRGGRALDRHDLRCRGGPDIGVALRRRCLRSRPVLTGSVADILQRLGIAGVAIGQRVHHRGRAVDETGGNRVTLRHGVAGTRSHTGLLGHLGPGQTQLLQRRAHQGAVGEVQGGEAVFDHRFNSSRHGVSPYPTVTAATAAS